MHPAESIHYTQQTIVSFINLTKKSLPSQSAYVNKELQQRVMPQLRSILHREIVLTIKASITLRAYLMSKDTKKSAMKNKKGACMIPHTHASFCQNIIVLSVYDRRCSRIDHIVELLHLTVRCIDAAMGSVAYINRPSIGASP